MGSDEDAFDRAPFKGVGGLVAAMLQNGHREDMVKIDEREAMNQMRCVMQYSSCASEIPSLHVVARPLRAMVERGTDTADEQTSANWRCQYSTR